MCRRRNQCLAGSAAIGREWGGAGRLSSGLVPAEVQIQPADVAHLAQLARLAVTDAELELFAGQLQVILGAVARVGEVATGGGDIEPMTHAVSMVNVFRADEVRPCLPRADVLRGAPSVEDFKFRVPRILGEEA
jgi:aspartyl-tRNA(Asn)/glutamyl-tRNA(Gln) amidotransferase subunit C